MLSLAKELNIVKLFLNLFNQSFKNVKKKLFLIQFFFLISVPKAIVNITLI
jgi:hypothetical protein